MLAQRLRRGGVEIVDLFAAHPQQRNELPSETRPAIVDLTANPCHNFRLKNRCLALFFGDTSRDGASKWLVRILHGSASKGS